MPIISPTLPNDGESADAADVNGPFSAILSLLNGGLDGDNLSPGSLPWSVMQSFSKQIPAGALQDSANAEKFRDEANLSIIATGLIWSALSGLNGAMTLGTFYAPTGLYVSVPAVATHAFTASKDTYVSVSPLGVLSYQEVANGAAQPSLTTDYLWLAKVVTSGSAVTSVTDLRKVNLIEAANVVPFLTTGQVDVAFNSASVTGSSSALVAGSGGNGTYRFQGILDLTSLNIPATARIISAQCWIGAAGNSTSQGNVPAAISAISNTSLTFYAQAAGNDSGSFPNLTNTHVIAYVRYLP
jgi:hypothetical protein